MKGCGGTGMVVRDGEPGPCLGPCDDCRPAKCGTCGGSEFGVTEKLSDPPVRTYHCNNPACTPAPAAKGCREVIALEHDGYELRCGPDAFCSDCAAAQQREIERLEKELAETVPAVVRALDRAEAAEARVRELEKENESLAAFTCDDPYSADNGSMGCRKQDTLRAERDRLQQVIDDFHMIEADDG